MVRVTLISVALATALVSAACSSSSAVCDDVAQLRTSIDSLENVDLGSTSADDLKGKVDAVKNDLSSLKQSASDDIGDEAGALESSLNVVATSAQALTDNPDASTLSTLTTDLSNTKTAWDALVAAIPDC